MTAAPGGLTPFPWQAVMHAGLGLLRLDPNAFWHMTPREFAAACCEFAPTRPGLERHDFEALMRLYPDGGEA